MGCDIHLFVEFGYDDAVRFPMDRSYLMFGLMAGVRGDEWLYEPKGLPAKLNTGTQRDYEFWKDDAHSGSWLTYEEYKKCVETYVEVVDEHNPEQRMNIETDKNVFFVLLKFLEDLNKRYENVRIVFWFDN